MPFKLSLVADVDAWLKGTADVEASLDSVADSLDDLARDTAQDADKAATDLKNEFTDAFDKVKTEAATTGRKVGDDIHDGARKAGDGIEDFKSEGTQSIRETAASLSDVTDALDLVQEVAANAFTGFGPAGMAAGALAAAGVGLVGQKLEEAEEAAEAARDRIISLAGELAEVDGQVEALDWGDKINELLYSKVTGDQTWIEKYGAGVRHLKLDSATFVAAMQGDRDALERVTTARDAALASQNQFTDAGAGAIDQINAATTAITQQNTEVNTARALFEQGDAAVGDFAEAQARAKQVSEDWAEALNDHLSVASDGLDEFVKDGKLDLKAWADEVKARTKDVATVEDFKVDIFPELSPEAQEAFAKLPVETQAQIAKAYKDGSKGDRKTIQTTLEAEVETKVNAADTTVEGKVTIPTEVDTASATAGAQAAADDAQAVANRIENRIEYKTKLDASDLQGDVNRAAAGITPPTVWVNVKVRKEVP